MAKTNMKLGIQMWSIHNVFVGETFETTARKSEQWDTRAWNLLWVEAQLSM